MKNLNNLRTLFIIIMHSGTVNIILQVPNLSTSLMVNAKNYSKQIRFNTTIVLLFLINST